MGALSFGAAEAFAADYAVYEEHSPETKPMQPGANLRALNRVITQRGDAIHLDPDTGIVSLKAVTYRISGALQPSPPQQRTPASATSSH